MDIGGVDIIEIKTEKAEYWTVKAVLYGHSVKIVLAVYPDYDEEWLKSVEIDGIEQLDCGIKLQSIYDEMSLEHAKLVREVIARAFPREISDKIYVKGGD